MRSHIEIGFENFRKYEYLEPIELRNITYLVGENNSGKSTFVKGVLLMINNLLNPKFPEFDFNIPNNPQLLGINVPTFESALNRNADTPEITFICRIKRCVDNQFMDYLFEIIVSNDSVKKNSGHGTIKKFYITDFANCLKYNFADRQIWIENIAPTQEYINELTRDLADINLYLESFNNRVEHIYRKYNYNLGLSCLFENPSDDEIEDPDINPMGGYSDSDSLYVDEKHYDEKHYLDDLRNALLKKIDWLQKNAATYKAKETKKKDCYVLQSPYKTLIEVLHSNRSDSDKEIASSLKTFFETENVKEIEGKIDKIASDIDKCIASLSYVKYIYAHDSKQQFIYNSLDLSDKTAQMVSLYAGKFGWMIADDLYEEFMGSWLNRFGIDKYIITEAVGDGLYKVYLSPTQPEKSKENPDTYINRNNWRPLATYGTGIIRIALLIMNLANILFDYMGKDNMNRRAMPIVIIEEPEMNLHPKYQSLLADLFLELSERYGFRFIIETHSEYMIRKTQVEVKNSRYESPEALNALNPFQVLYFPQNEDPYQMEYRTDGRFKNKFGKGFYDEANSLIFQII